MYCIFDLEYMQTGIAARLDANSIIALWPKRCYIPCYMFDLLTSDQQQLKCMGYVRVETISKSDGNCGLYISSLITLYAVICLHDDDCY